MRSARLTFKFHIPDGRQEGGASKEVPRIQTDIVSVGIAAGEMLSDFSLLTGLLV